MATRAIPDIEPWHRKMWSEKEVIAMMGWKGRSDSLYYWENFIKPRVQTYGGNYNSEEVYEKVAANPDMRKI